MKNIRYIFVALFAVMLVLGGTACRAGGEPGTVKIVRNGGPYDNKQIKGCISAGQTRKWIGMNSTTHPYPAIGVQRYFKITTEAGNKADFKGVVKAKSADGFNIHTQGTFEFQTLFDCVDGQPNPPLLAFEKQFGVRKFPLPGDDKTYAPWDGETGWDAFLNAQLLPVIQNELRKAMLKFTCEELVASCSLVASRGDTQQIDKAKAKATGVNLEAIQESIAKGLSEELKATFGNTFFTNVKFLMSQPELDPDIENAINTSLASFASVSQAQAQVQQSIKQAQAARNIAKVYQQTPQLADLEKWRIICGVKTGDNTTSKCGNATFIMGDSGNVQVKAGK